MQSSPLVVPDVFSSQTAVTPGKGLHDLAAANLFGPGAAASRNGFALEAFLNRDGIGLDIIHRILRGQEERAHSHPVFGRKSSELPQVKIDRSNVLVKAVPQIVKLFEDHDCLVLTAPTGTGKTTILPLALAEANYDVVVASPRRLLTELAAKRLAWHFGEDIGKHVGFAHGFENKCNPANIIRCYTDAYLFVEQLLRRDPEMSWSAKSIVIVDEFHEGGLGVHFLAAELFRQQAALRAAGAEPFKVMISSATLDAAMLSEMLGAPHLEVQRNGRTAVPRHFLVAERAHLCATVADRVRRGRDVLILAAGKPEIEQVIKELEEGLPLLDAELPYVEYIPLDSRTSPENRRRAAAPANGSPRVIVSTLARTGVTFDVRDVIDLGRCRDKVLHGATNVLRLRSVTDAELEQGLGRIGRIDSSARRADPDSYVLMGETSFEELRAFPEPEILRGDICGFVLRIAVAGRNIRDLRFPVHPGEERIAAAEERLRRLGLFSEQSHPTKLGKLVARIPLEPLLGALVARALVLEEKLERDGVTLHRGYVEAAITMAAVVVNEGLHEQNPAALADRPFAGTYRYANGKNEQSSDFLAQLALFRAAGNWKNSIAQFRQQRVSPVAFEKTVELRGKLLNRLDVPDQPVRLMTLRAELLDLLRQSFVHSVFVREGLSWRNQQGEWNLSRYSVVGNNLGTKLIAGEAMIIQGMNGYDSHTIFFATEIPPKWYQAYAPKHIRSQQPHVAAVLREANREQHCHRVHPARRNGGRCPVSGGR